MLDLAPLVLKTVPFRFRGADISLDLSHALFSSFDIDVGTRLLCKAIGKDERLAEARRVLDAGSGVGVIGIAVAKAFPACQVEARDRDLLARAFTARNAARNKVRNLRAAPGLIGAGELGGRYDYILSNVPAKAGGPVIEAFIAEAGTALNPGGRLGLVVVTPLVDATRAALGAAGFELLQEERGSMHRAFVAARPGGGAALPSLEAAPPASPGAPEPAPEPVLGFEACDFSAYRRRTGDFSLLGKRYRATGFWGLPDFDTIGYGQHLAAEMVQRAASGGLVREALVINPGIGHAALWAALSLGPERITAASRDFLSLAATGENLRGLSGSSVAYRAVDGLRLDELPEASFDLLLEFADPVPGYDWIAPIWDRAARLTKRGASFVFVAPPTETVRLEKRRPAGFRLLGEKRKKGLAAVAWRRE